MGVFRFLLLGAILVALAVGAPQEKDAVAVVAEDKVDEPKKSGTGVVVADETWDTWLKENAWGIAGGIGGAVLIIVGLSVGGHYFYQAYYHKLTGNANEGAAYVDPVGGYQYRDFSAQNQVPGYPNQYYSSSIGRYQYPTLILILISLDLWGRFPRFHAGW